MESEAMSPPCDKCGNPVDDENFGFVRLIGKEDGKAVVIKRPIHSECAAPSKFVAQKLAALGSPWTEAELRESFIKGGMIPGHRIWKFYSTRGYPLDLAIVTAKERGLTINLRGFFECWERSI